MGRRENSRPPLEPLEVGNKLPSFFRCPISLEVMKSPVSLCTGVTYDRASIQRWLESGHRTCPATALPLPSTDLVPNLTLKTLIQLWSHSASKDPTFATKYPAFDPHDDLLRDDPLPALRRIAHFFSHPDSGDDKNRLLDAGGLASALAGLMHAKDAALETVEAAVRVFALVLTTDSIDKDNRKTAVASLLADLDASASVLIDLLKRGSGLDPRIDAARVLESILTSSACDDAAKLSIVERPELFPELVRLVAEEASEAIGAGLRCLVAAAEAGGRLARPAMVRAGAVPAVARALRLSPDEVPAAAGEMGLRAMAAAARCAEGRAAMGGEAAGEWVGAVMGRMLKVGPEGREAAVAALWAVACRGGGERQAREAVAAEKGAMGKILVLMQGECSPAAARMAGDLLRICKVDSSSCLAGYDTKTTHIMPY